MSCCCGHHHHHCYHGGWPEPYPPYPWRYGSPPREEYVRGLEEERDMLERRLRRLEQELEELRKSARPTAEQA